MNVTTTRIAPMTCLVVYMATVQIPANTFVQFILGRSAKLKVTELLAGVLMLVSLGNGAFLRKRKEILLYLVDIVRKQFDY